MAERRAYIAKVTGSSPVSPTTNKVGLRCQKVRNVLFAPSTRSKINAWRGLRPTLFKETTFKKSFLLNVPLSKATGDVVQLVRTSDCRSEGRGSKARRPRHIK